ncbi:hypothetical protein [Halopenitus persicus]|uniref:hypothetical protein n=1 Tax=Halopenitus persicus TaxID=1048396 RepID=UPI000BBB1D6D|nr:hypothetical protein [Halopenitus persicus]
MTKSFDEHFQDKQIKEDEWSRQRLVRELIKRCSRALARDDRKHYQYVAVRMTELDEFLIDDAVGEVYQYGEQLADWDGWHWLAIKQFHDEPKKYIAQLGKKPPSSTEEVQLRAKGLVDGHTRAKNTVEKAFKSYVCIAEYEGLIPEEMRDRADALAFGTKVGEHIQSREMDLGEEVGIITDQSGPVKVLYSGGTGQGKSASEESEEYAFYCRNFEPGEPNTKIIDVMGFSFENWFKDIPQQQASLKRIRDEFGLAEDVTHPELPRPELEVYHPYTPDLPDAQIPYDTNSEEFLVKPYTVAAADIPSDLFISLMGGRLTEQQAAEIETAYDKIDEEQDDWSLADLIEQIKSLEDTDAGVKARAIHAVERLQRQGWIRTSECEYNIDFDEVMNDEETITVFSQAYMDDLASKLMAFGHLVNVIPSIRKNTDYGNECVLVMRELWEVVPHSRRTSSDDHAEALQKEIGTNLGKTFRRNRHQSIHVLADTQKIGDIHISVREMFNRYVIFNEKKDSVKNAFSYVAADKWKRFYETLNQKAGQAGVVGQVEESVERDRIEFLSPIHYAPAPFHHWDEKKDQGGPAARVKYVQNEKLRSPADVEHADWSLEEPETPTAELADEDSEYDPKMHPMLAYVEECVEQASGNTAVDDVKTSHNEYREAVGREKLELGTRSGQVTFANDFTDACAEVLGFEPEKRELSEGYVYEGIQLTAAGKEYLDTAREPEVEDASEPIDTDR